MKGLSSVRTLIAALVFVFVGDGLTAQLLVENFEYSNGSLLTANGWTAHSGGGTQPIDVVVPGLSFTGYVGSGIGGAAFLDNTGEDVNRTFAEQTSGTVYVAFMVKTGATNSAGYFFHLGQSPFNTSVFFSRVYVNSAGNGLGISGSSQPTSYVSISPETTVLVVVKLDITTKVSSLYVLNSFSATEPATPNQIFTESNFSNVGSVALRQYNAAQRVTVDGIRVANTWADAVGASATSPASASVTITEVIFPDMFTIIGNGKTETVNISGTKLTNDINLTISGKNASRFTVTPNKLTKTDDEVDFSSVTITYTPVSEKIDTALLIASSVGADSISLSLIGKGIILNGYGTTESPFTIGDVKKLNNSYDPFSQHWVQGFISGVPLSGDFSGNLTVVELHPPFISDIAIALSDDTTETDLTKMIGVELPYGEVNSALNLQSNPDNHKKGIKVFGKLSPYFGTTPGVTATSQHIILDTSVPHVDKKEPFLYSIDDQLHIVTAESSEVQIHDLLGKQIYNSNLQSGENIIELKQSGVMIVKIGRYTKKIVIRQL